ncbi:ABC-type urea transporter UrtABCDE, subunit B [Solemya velum gill symbiont]|uniref:ABC-type urea transporter UrtABCDE, subunit B n=1 Tax=Solemya velum gill symbiont TaxID=2340 RepID=A0A0B0HAM0_SOVGS|nr:urea ABC transporter permease subunit UrtB [Solemya velum gill symbiont]KHF24476.1 ABC-type urea transporter UrtABCDE, subunit B [Solemya velum gill symbiont]
MNINAWFSPTRRDFARSGSFSFLLLIFFLLALLVPVSTAFAEETPTFESAIAQLSEKSYKVKGSAIDTIAGSGHEKASFILQSMFDGSLFYHKKSKQLLLVEKEGSKYLTFDALTGDKGKTVKKRAVKKVSINNTLRSQLRSLIASLNLQNPDAEIRLASVREMLGSVSPETATLLNSYIETEENADVRDMLNIAINLSELDSDNKQTRLDAIDYLSGSLETDVYNKIKTVSESDSEESVRTEALKALEIIEDRRKLSSMAETLFFGISLGSVLVLAAIGLAITFGVMGVINMAHGELIMLGAYTTYLVQTVMPDYPGVALILSIPAAFLVSGTMGIAIERGIIRHLYGRPLETLLATFGVSLILQQLVRTVISPQNVPVSNPEWMSGSIEINSVLSLTMNRLYIIAFCLVVFAVLFMILKKTSLGLQVRAVAQNRSMARAMGVRSERVDALTFGLGSGIAGIAGVALSQLTNVGPNLGQAYIVDSFMVVVFGGVGNLWGTLVGGLSLGVANKILEPWSGAVLAKILVLVFIILFIQKRPRGLFPQKGRAAGD